MSADWPSVELQSLIEPERGISYGIVQPGAAVSDGVPIVRVSDVRDGCISIKAPLRVAKEIEAAYSRTRLQGGELLVTIVGTVGETAIVPDALAGWNVARAIAVLPIKPEVGGRWVKRALRAPAANAQIHSRLNTTVQATLNLGDLAKLPILMPPPLERERIEAILGTLDDKIDLNRRINETLEAMVRAIFKDWFVDFGPTCAKMEGRAPYLEPKLWALFPDRLDNEGKPAGWVEKPLDEIAEFLNGLALQKYPAVDTSFLPVIKIAQLRAGSAASADKAATTVPARYIVEDGDVLFSWSGSLLHRVWTAGRGALNQHLFKVTSAHHPKWFFFHWIGHHLSDFQAIAASKATTMGHIQRHHLQEAMTIVPDQHVMRVADELIGPLFERGIALDLECRTLATMRDFLLPKLMSGEIGVKDAEKVAAAA
jgi:type I restriction enzyme S subunit